MIGWGLVSLDVDINIPQHHQSNSENNKADKGGIMKCIKLKSILFGLLMAFVIINPKAYGQFSYNGFAYKIESTAESDNYAIITAYGGGENIDTISFPSNIQGIPVTRIRLAAILDFYKQVTSVIIPDSVNTINDGVFNTYKFPNLESVVLPEKFQSFEEIVRLGAEHCFDESNHNNLKYRNIYGKILITGFDGNINRIINIPSEIAGLRVVRIGEKAFMGCKILSSVQIPSSITSIGTSAFQDCEDLISVNISENVVDIGLAAFQNCVSLAEIVVPRGVAKIRGNTFYQCWGLASIQLPKNLTSIDAYALAGCRSLTSLSIPSGVVDIGDNAFSDGRSMTSVAIPKKFHDSHEAWRLGISHLWPDGFSLPNANQEPVDSGKLGDLFFAFANDGQIAITDCDSSVSGELIIPSEIKGIPVSVIERNAFTSCRDLLSVIIPDSVSTIEAYAFSDCLSLSDVSIPDSVTNIGDNAFNGCSNLTSITIPDSVTSIGGGAFFRCNITSIFIPEYFHGNLKALQLGLGSIWPQGFFLPDGRKINPLLTKLSYEKNNGLVHITDCDETAFGAIEIPQEIDGLPVVSIRDRAFSDCSLLTSITIPNSVTTIGNRAFSSCKSLTSLTIPDGVNRIGWEAFLECSNLNFATIPNSVSFIGYGAFSGCKRLKSITIPKVFHSYSEANRLELSSLWHGGFSIPTSVTRTPELSIRLPLQLILTGDQNFEAVIEATDNLKNPWTEWGTVVIGKDGTTEVDLDVGAEKRFYRIRN